MRVRILPYKQGSRSAKALAEALNARVLKLVGSMFVPKPSDLVINWGVVPDTHPCNRASNLNIPEEVRKATNKLEFFNSIKESGLADLIPLFWSNKNEIPEDQFPVVCRTVLSGHSGAGIVLANDCDDLVDAPLYTKYIKKEHEYRVHVGCLPDGTYSAFAVQRKARRIGHENPNWQIRNHSNGFVYVRQGFVTPDVVTEAAVEVFKATGLDFGAVDVIYNKQADKAYVLEINSAPGLQGQTITDYKNFFLAWANAS